MNSKDILGTIKAYFESTYYCPEVQCYLSNGYPCGPERKTIRGSSESSEVFCPPSLPAIGPSYGEKRRVVFVGLNPNLGWMNAEEYTDVKARELFVKWADKDNPGNWEASGFRKRVTRMAKAALGVQSDADNDILPFIAYTNLIKCSSSSKRCRPSYRMRVNCPAKIWGELDLLKPELVIALGSYVHETLTTSAAHQKRRVFVPEYPWCEFVSELELDGCDTPLVCMYHPSDTRSINKSWANMRDKGKPAERLYDLLKVVFDDEEYPSWSTKIAEMTSISIESSGENILLKFLEDQLLSPDQHLSESAWKGWRDDQT